MFKVIDTQTDRVITEFESEERAKAYCREWAVKANRRLAVFEEE